MKQLYLLISLFTLFSNSHSLVLGTIYPIQEKDLISTFHRLAKSNKIKALFEKLQETIQDQIKTPITYNHLSNATKDRTFYYDPSFYAPYTIRDELGNVIVEKGIRVNPLSIKQPQYALVLINAKSKRQMHWAQRLLRETKKIHLILVEGSPTKVAKQLHCPVYFDQAGRIANQFHLRALPVMVTALKDKLKIQEYAV